MPKKSRAQNQLATLLVPDGEREHAAQAVEHAFAPCQIAREQDFGVGVGLELPALRLELAAQIAVVVDLAVEHDGEAPLGGSLLGRAARGAIKAQRRRGDDGGMVAVERTMGWLPLARSMSERRRWPKAMPLSASMYWPSPSGPRWAMTSHMAFSVGRLASSACVNPQIPHMVRHPSNRI